LRFLDVNDAAIFHYGYSYEEFMKIDITEIMVENSIDDFKSVLESHQEAHQNLFLGLQNHKKKDGEIIQVELRANSYIYDGRPAEIISINDVTEKNQQIRAIEQQNRILKEIAWTQSHVVRAPVARLMGLVKAMQEQDLSDSDKNVFFNHILTSADELDQIIRSVVNKSQEVNTNNQKE
jgi:PAS domain S-box-containing protein